MHFRTLKSVVYLCCFAVCAIHAVAAFGQIEPQAGDEKSKPHFNKEAHASTQYLHQIALANAEVLGKQFSVAEAILMKCPPELRRWEWHYLRRLSNLQITSYRVPNTGMWGVEYSPDGSMVATGGFREVHLWNASTGKRLHLWKPKKGWVSSVAFSNDGKRVASVSFQEGNVWDTKTGKELVTFEAHERLGYCIDFSPDGRFIATGGNSAEAEFATKGAGVTKVWDAETGELRFQLYQKSPVVDLQYSPDGRWIAAVSGKSSYTESKYPSPFNIWDAKTGELVHELEGHEVWQSCLAFSPDAQRLVVGGNDGNVRVWDLKNRKLTHVMSGHKRHLTGVAFTPDGSKVLSSSADTEVRLWDAQSGELIEVIAGPRGKISGMAISPDGRSFVTAVESGKERGAKIWKLPGGDVSRKDSGQCVAFSPDGTTYAIGSHPKDGDSKSKIRIRQSASHATVGEWEFEYPLRVRDLDFSPDGKRLLASGDNGFSVWNLETNQAEFTVPMYGIDITYAAAYSPDGSTIVVRESMYDARNGKKIFTLGLSKWLGQKKITGVDYSADGKQVATANWGGFEHVNADGKKEVRGGHVTVWDAATGKEQLYIPGGGYGVVFTQDGSGIITGDDQGRLIRFDSKTGRKVWSTQAHASGVFRVARTPDGSRLVSIGKDRAARLWDPETGAQVLVLHALSAQGMSVAAGKHTIGVACEDGGLHLWDGRPSLGN